MASHAGTMYYLQCEKGFIDEYGNIVEKREDAWLINFNQVGFCEADSAYNYLFRKKCPYHLRYLSIVSSYQDRLYDISKLLRLINQSNICYYANVVRDYRDYIKSIEKVTEKVYEYLEENNMIIDNFVFLEEVIKVGQADDDFYFDYGNYRYYRVFTKIGVLYRYDVFIKGLENCNQKDLFNYINTYINDNKFSLSLNYDAVIYNMKIKEGQLILYIDDFSYELLKELYEVVNEYLDNQVSVCKKIYK